MKKIGFWKVFSFMAVTAGVVMAAFPALAELGQPTNWAYGFQEPASPMKEQMEHFHNDLLLPLTVIISLFVLALLLFVMVRFNAKANPVPSKNTHNTILEVVWTLVPVIILVCLVVPSLKMLYFVDKAHNPEMTLKITGYQWYWGYEYPDHGGINFLANLDKEKQPRLLATDNEIVLPVDTDIQLLITASDVLHSWAVPAFGVKMDAVPGRANETWVRIDKEGTFYGQCSELCGQGHGFMPIQVRAVSKEAFAEWVNAQGGKMPEPKAEAGEAKAETPAPAAAPTEEKKK